MLENINNILDNDIRDRKLLCMVVDYLYFNINLLKCNDLSKNSEYKYIDNVPSIHFTVRLTKKNAANLKLEINSMFFNMLVIDIFSIIPYNEDYFDITYSISLYKDLDRNILISLFKMLMI